MGFIRQQNASGRWAFACEAGVRDQDQPYCKGSPCRAHHCPFGWCQRYYICQACWSRAEIKARFSKAAHESCRQNAAEWAVRNVQRDTILASGAYLRCSALSIDAGRVHVLFENQTGQTVGRYMSPETYHVFPLLENKTVEDYASVGVLTDAPGTFEYGQTTKEVAA